MIHFSFGVPSRFTDWCQDLLADLIAAKHGLVERLMADSLDAVGRELLARECTNCLISGRAPNASLCEHLISLGRPVLVALDAPDHAIGALMTDHRVPYAEAVRQVANSLASLLPLVRYERALVLFETDARETAKSIADHLQLGLDDTAIRHIAEKLPLPAAASAPDERFAPEPIEGYVALTRSKRIAAVTALWKHLQGGPLDEIVWPAGLFRVGGSADGAPLAPIDLTGQGHCIVFGPYLRLPKGRWLCKVSFACSERARGVRMVVEVFSGIPLAVVRTVLAPGVQEIDCSFVNANADQPLEIRLITTEEALEGELLFGQARLSLVER